MIRCIVQSEPWRSYRLPSAIVLSFLAILLLGAQQVTPRPASDFLSESQTQALSEATQSCRKARDDLFSLAADCLIYAKVNGGTEAELSIALTMSCSGLAEKAQALETNLFLLSRMKCGEDFITMSFFVLPEVANLANAAGDEIKRFVETQGVARTPAVVLACDKARASAGALSKALNSADAILEPLTKALDATADAVQKQ